MVPLRAARVLPRPGSVHPAAITIDRRAPFPGLSVSLHTGREKCAESERPRIAYPSDEALNDGDD